MSIGDPDAAKMLEPREGKMPHQEPDTFWVPDWDDVVG